MMTEPELEVEHGAGAYTPMVVTVEVWPVAADEFGIWLVSGEDGPWPTSPVPNYSEPHAWAELELMRRGLRADTALLHSTSWRAEESAMVTTWMAVIRCQGLVRESFPDARPVSPRVADVVGRPPTHGPVEPPTVRYWDVLLHGIRHLAFLIDTDATAALALHEPWREHLEAWEPTVAKMYDEPHQD
jgi:hypothetical protein